MPEIPYCCGRTSTVNPLIVPSFSLVKLYSKLWPPELNLRLSVKGCSQRRCRTNPVECVLTRKIGNRASHSVWSVEAVVNPSGLIAACCSPPGPSEKFLAPSLHKLQPCRPHLSALVRS